MIRPRYALMLAYAKLRAKKVVLAVSVAVASLLFATLVAVVILFTGAQKSAESFVKEVSDGHYLVRVDPNIPVSVTSFGGSAELPSETIAEIREYEDAYYASKQRQYEQLGIPYNESTEVSGLREVPWATKEDPEGRRFMVNYASPVVDELLEKKFEKYVETAPNTVEKIKEVAARYGATHFYEERPALLLGFPSLRVIQDNKEDFNAQPKQDAYTYTMQLNTIYNGNYLFADDTLLQRYLFTVDSTQLKGIPVVPSAQEVATLFGKELGVKKEPELESEKAAWIRTIQDKAQGFTYQVCYRNGAELTLLKKIQQDYTEMQANQDKEGYQKPSVIYDYPTSPCGDIVVKEDTRTTAESAADLEAEEIQKKLGTYMEPEHRLLTFQIVGVMYMQPFQSSFSDAKGYIKSLLAPNDRRPVIGTRIPTQMYQTLPDSMRINDLAQPVSGRAAIVTSDKMKGQIVELTSLEAARDFLLKEGCRPESASCDKPFYTSVFGANYLILDDLASMFSKVMSIILPILFSLALVIIWLTMSRIMADSRKETAVYRAMGARRSDIAAVYFTYIAVVAAVITVASLALGSIIALCVQIFYVPELNLAAASLYGVVDTAPKVHLFDVSSPLIVVISGLIFFISLIASIQPLVRNVLRPPVQDMRSDN